MTFQAARSLVPDDSQAMLSAILESATDYAIITTDLDQVITTWNAGARNIMGWEEAEIVGQHVSVIFTPEDRANRCPDAEMEKALEEGRAVDERWHSRKDGSRFWATGLMMPLKTADGVAIGCLKILGDQTDERLASETARVDAEFMRQLLESSNDCIKVLDLEGRLQFMSAGGQRIMEVDDFSKFLDCPWPEFWHDELNQAAREAVATAATGGSARFRGQAATAKGTLRWWDVQVTPINGADGRPERLLSISRDITDAHLAEEASRERETYLRLLLDSASEGFYAVDRDGTTTLCNAAFVAMLGFGKPEDAVGRKLHDVIHHTYPDGSPYPRCECPIYRTAQTGEPARVEDELFFRLDGTSFPVDYTVHPIWREGTLQGAVCTFNDITERKRATEELTNQAQAEGERLRRLFQQAPGFMAVLREPEHVFELANDAYMQLVGRRDLIGRSVRNALPEVVDQGFLELLDDVRNSGKAFQGREVPIRLQKSSGGPLEEHFVDFVYQPITGPEGAVSGIFVDGSDVTDRVRAKERLACLVELGDRLRTLRSPTEIAGTAAEILGRKLRASRAGYGTFDPSGEFVTIEHDWTNGTVTSIKGVHRLSDFGNLSDALRRGEVLVISDVAQDPRTMTSAAAFAGIGVASLFNVPVIETGRLAAVLYIHDSSPRTWSAEELALVQDVADRTWRAAEGARSEEALRRLNETLETKVEDRTASLRLEMEQRERAEQALRQSQKMEAVGQLTGGIAHDFNNLLTGIVGSLDLMQTRMAQGRTENIERYVKAAMASANRAAALTHRLLAFARRQTLDPKPVDANHLITSMEDLLRRSLGESIQMEFVTAGGLWPTLCDANQLENAILNLAINARDAMPEGGKLTIETCNAHLDSAYAARQRDVTPGQYVCICVTDTGTGMPSDVIARAFDPFFTTKPLGQGTGLGLSMIYGFARQSEGHAKIYSEVGKGTTIKIYLPRFRGSLEQEADATEGHEMHRAEAGETVLVVEDDPVVRNLILEVLQDLGYRALEASDGPSGLAVLRSRKRIDLLVTDVGLPGLNGRQLADQARERRPGLKVLFITGYAEKAAMSNGFLEPGMQMMTKPFAIEALAARIRTIIES